MDGSTTTRLEHRSAQLIDQFGRHKHKLRISLTDRCSYCMPDTPEWLAKKDILSFKSC